MNIVSLSIFLQSFQSPHDNCDIDHFIQHATIDTNGRRVPIRNYINSGKIPPVAVQALYRLAVVNKDAYLRSFYSRSLRTSLPQDLIKLSSETPMTIQRGWKNNTKPTYKNLIRNLFYLDILLYTKTDIPNTKPYWEVIRDMFIELVIDYKLVTPSGLHYIQEGSSGSILSGFYFRSSIMNPYLVYSIQQSYLQGKRIFTPTMGWCSYMVGFMASPITTHYVGIDVIPHVCATAQQLYQSYYSSKHISIHCTPSEDLLHDEPFIHEHGGQYDTIFFSPPYYRLELYQGGEQSTDRYKTYQDWLNGYWRQTIQLCYIVGTPTCKMCYIVSSYDKYKNLVRDMNAITTEYCELESQIPLGNSRVNNTNHSENSEMIHFFRRKN